MIDHCEKQTYPFYGGLTPELDAEFLLAYIEQNRDANVSKFSNKTRRDAINIVDHSIEVLKILSTLDCLR